MTRWFVPGRIEVLGKHTDYGGGRSLLAATEQGLTLSATPARDVSLKSDVQGHHYVESVVTRLRADYQVSSGAQVTVTSTLPAAAGLSSSSALVTGLVLTLADLWSIDLPSGSELVEYVASVERGVGVRGGAEDHAAMLLTRAGHLLPCRFRPVRPEPHVPWREDLSFVVAVSGVVAEKALGTRERYHRTARVLERIEAAGVPLDRLVDDPSEWQAWRQGLDMREARRLEQFVVESGQLIPHAVASLQRDDWEGFADAVQISHRLGVAALENAVPETEDLVARAHSLGAEVASPFGAGFGGSVYAVVPLEEVEQFAAEWHDRTLITRPGGPATRLD
ncbi:MAG: galactokinase family protein [Gemmatimonadales bacterium]